jgi:hypothetical protein
MSTPSSARAATLAELLMTPRPRAEAPRRRDVAHDRRLPKAAKQQAEKHGDCCYQRDSGQIGGIEVHRAMTIANRGNSSHGRLNIALGMAFSAR